MNLHDHHAEGPPCRHMESHLQRTADGTAGRFARIYALAHAARCGRCGRFLHRLEETLSKLRAGKEDPPEETISRILSGPWRDEA